MKYGKGFHLTAPSGGTGRIVAYTSSVGGGCKNLSQAEFAAFKRAKLICSPDNGSRWDEARELLESAGLEVLVG